jgi:hypothetical protein
MIVLRQGKKKKDGGVAKKPEGNMERKRKQY